MAGRVAGKIKLQTVDELLGVPEIAGTQEIELGRIHAFPNHPFKVLDDERMDMLVESIRENGILNPVIVRPDKNGDYVFYNLNSMYNYYVKFTYNGQYYEPTKYNANRDCLLYTSPSPRDCS